MQKRKKNDDNCIQYAITVVLNYEQIKKDSQRISKINHLLINTIGNR